MKAEIYHSLCAINESLEQVTEHLDKLKGAEVLRQDFTDIRKLTAEQLRAEINTSATLAMHTQETHEAAAVEQERIRQEKLLEPES